jgi:serine protease AprX
VTHRTALIPLMIAAIATSSAAQIAGGEASSDAAKIAPDLAAAIAERSTSDSIPVIIDLSGVDEAIASLLSDRRERRLLARTLRTRDAARRGALMQSARALGGRRLRDLWISGSVAATLPRRAIRRIARLRSVEAVRLDAQVIAPDVTFAPSGPIEWNVERVGAPALWSQGYDGAGAVVGVIDTGVDALHLDLLPRWREEGGWFDASGEFAAPTDFAGHGTTVTSLAVGGEATGAAIGVAPGAQWIGARIFDSAGYGTISDIHLAFQWMLDPDGNPETDDAPDVVNGSFGLLGTEGVCLTDFDADFAALKAAGIAVVMSAGNSGPDLGTGLSPATAMDAFAVGASTMADQPAGFSSRGPSPCGKPIFPDVLAPGDTVAAADLTYGGLIPDSFTYVSGTTAAAPSVAGAVALLKQAFPEEDGATLLDLLARSAVPPPGGPDEASGNGLIDVEAAFQLAVAEGLVPAPGGSTGGGDPDDADGDGYATALDCDDADASIHPDATETPLDGVDQDCNGYDLTIQVSKYVYRKRKSKLVVEATSALGQEAALEIEGFGPMKWNKRKSLWRYVDLSVTEAPSELIVTGTEGSLTWSPGS